VVANCVQATTGGACLASASAVQAALPGASTQSMYKVIIAVTWPDRNCAGARCSSAISTLVGTLTQNPVFNNTTELPPPSAVNPGAQSVALGGTVALQLNATTTTSSPLTWTAYTGLPAGLTGDSSGKVTGTATASGAFSVTATVRDAYYQTAAVTFGLTVSSPMSLTNPGTQTSTRYQSDSLTLTAANGTSPYTYAMGTSSWGATGLPPGLTLNASTGIISGSPSTAGSYPVTAKVTDASGATTSVTFTWTVTAPLLIDPPGSPTTRVNVAATLQMTITGNGGTAPYTWSAISLPPGLTINSTTGKISGTPTTISPAGTSYNPTVKVVDSTGALNTMSFNWTVTA
jgi:hypothetical protein